MKKNHSDYIYKNTKDSLRFRVFRRRRGFWDYDLFNKNGIIATFSTSAGNIFRTKKETLGYIKKIHGKIISINPESTVTNGMK